MRSNTPAPFASLASPVVRGLLAATILVTGLSAFALGETCPAPEFTQASDVQITGDTLLLLTHPSSQWDEDRVAKPGVDATVAFAKSQSIPVVYLHNGVANPTYYYQDCHPDYFVQSMGGEFNFAFSSHHVIVAGGYLIACLGTSIQQIRTQWKSQVGTKQNFKLSLVTDGIFTGHYISNPQDESQKDSRDLNLLEDLQRLRSQNRLRSYLKDFADAFDDRGSFTRAGYSIVVESGDERLVLNPGAGPTVTIELIESKDLASSDNK